MADEKKDIEKQAAAPAAAGTPAGAPAPVAEAASAEAEGADKKKAEGVARAARSRGARAIPFGIAFVTASFNNTFVAITDPKGNVVCWSSAGRAGFKGSRKSTAFAATVVGQEAARQAVARGMHEVEVRVQGPGAGRESAVRALQASGLNVSVIKDITPMPHNGCRPRKRRRV